VISVLLVDDEALVRAGLRMIVETADDMTVVGEAHDGRHALDAVAAHQPDVVLMDIGLGQSNADIATRLYMSEATVKSHITHLFEKLAATNRVQLAIAAFRAGLVE
jgi:DNA-binding NarL/FixJ family response regulator